MKIVVIVNGESWKSWARPVMSWSSARPHFWPIMLVLMGLVTANISHAQLGDSGSTAATQDAYIKLASHCALPLITKGGGDIPSQDATKRMAEEKELLLEIQAMNNVDPELRSIALEIRDAIQQKNATMARLQRLPSPPEGLESTMMNLYYGFTLQYEKAQNFNTQAKSQSETIQNELRDMMDSFVEMEALRLMLPRIAKKTANPNRAPRDFLIVDIDEAWGINYPDLLALDNFSGRALHNCTVVVVLTGIDGAPRENVHFIKTWLPGERRIGIYGSGTEVVGRVIDRRTVTLIQTASIKVYCDEFTSEPIQYKYAGQEKDADIGQSLDKTFKPRSGYRPYSEGLLWDDQRAVQVSFTGLQFLYNGTMTVTVKKGEQSASKSQSFKVWAAGETKWTEFKEIGWDPDEWSVKFTFQDTSVSRSYRWTKN